MLVNGYPTNKKHSSADQIISPGFVPFDSGDLNYNIWIAGDTFLSRYMTIYSRDDNSVGITKPWFENIKKIQRNERK